MFSRPKPILSASNQDSHHMRSLDTCTGRYAHVLVLSVDVLGVCFGAPLDPIRESWRESVEHQ